MEASDYIPDAYILDPDGDVIITLHNFDPPFPSLFFEEELPPEEYAVVCAEVPDEEDVGGVVTWRMKKKEKKKKKKRLNLDTEVPVSDELLPLPKIPAPEPAPEPEPMPELVIQFQASSAHLRLGSRYFKKALDGCFQESTSTPDGLRRIDADGWDTESFLIVMRIIHGHSRQVPRSMSLQLLAKVATIVDYYECHEIIEPFTEIWYSKMEKPTTPTTINSNLILLLLVSWVFSWPNEFKDVTRVAQNQSKELLSTMGLPIPESIISIIDDRRRQALSDISSMFTTLLENFRREEPQCCEACSSISLGTLERCLFHQKNLQFHASSERSLAGYSVASAIEAVREIKAPHWSENSRRSYYHSCSYSLETQLEEMMSRLEQFEGLDMQSFPSKGNID